jgi:hypothetical protein
MLPDQVVNEIDVFECLLGAKYNIPCPTVYRQAVVTEACFDEVALEHAYVGVMGKVPGNTDIVPIILEESNDLLLSILLT